MSDKLTKTHRLTNMSDKLTKTHRLTCQTNLLKLPG